MRQFIPFEDDWDLLEQLKPEALVPYRRGLPCAHAQRAVEPVASTGPERGPEKKSFAPPSQVRRPAL